MVQGSIVNQCPQIVVNKIVMKGVAIERKPHKRNQCWKDKRLLHFKKGRIISFFLKRASMIPGWCGSGEQHRRLFLWPNQEPPLLSSSERWRESVDQIPKPRCDGRSFSSEDPYNCCDGEIGGTPSKES